MREVVGTANRNCESCGEQNTCLVIKEAGKVSVTILCRSCAGCQKCGSKEAKNVRIRKDGSVFCRSCGNEIKETCLNCGKRVWRKRASQMTRNEKHNFNLEKYCTGIHDKDIKEAVW